MFYVTDDSIHLMEFDRELKVYPEVQVLLNSDGAHIIKKTGSGSAKKPKGCSVCTIAEILAQFHGTFVQEEASDESEGKGTGAPDLLKAPGGTDLKK